MLEVGPQTLSSIVHMRGNHTVCLTYHIGAHFQAPAALLRRRRKPVG